MSFKVGDFIVKKHCRYVRAVKVISYSEITESLVSLETYLLGGGYSQYVVNPNDYVVVPSDGYYSCA